MITVADVIAPASFAVAGLGLVLAALAFAATGRLMATLPLLLDMLLAAGLLRLSAEAPWPAIATAATIVGIRKLVATGLRHHP